MHWCIDEYVKKDTYLYTYRLPQGDTYGWLMLIDKFNNQYNHEQINIYKKYFFQ